MFENFARATEFSIISDVRNGYSIILLENDTFESTVGDMDSAIAG